MGFFLIPKISAANHGISIVGEKMGKRAIWVIVTQIAQLFSVWKIPFHFVNRIDAGTNQDFRKPS